MRRLLDAFSRWFGSAGGVIETFVVVAAVITTEYLAPNLDPHWFWLLVWLTVYSGVTQPALAFGNEKASRQIAALEQQIYDMERAHGSLLEAIAKALEIEVET